MKPPFQRAQVERLLETAGGNESFPVAPFPGQSFSTIISGSDISFLIHHVVSVPVGFFLIFNKHGSVQILTRTVRIPCYFEIGDK